MSPHAFLGACPQGELSREQAGRGKEPGGLDRKLSINGHTSKQCSALEGPLQRDPTLVDSPSRTECLRPNGRGGVCPWEMSEAD